MTGAGSAVVLVTRVGAAGGSRAAAAALACGGPESTGLLIDLSEAGSPRPALIATAEARAQEERLAAQLPEAGIASRGQLCHLSLPADEAGVAQISAALPVARESVAVIHLPPRLLQPVLGETRIRASGALLRADLDRDRALTALAVREAVARDLRVAVLKHPLGWIASRCALFGVLAPAAAGGLPPRILRRLLGDADPLAGPQ